jgi:hypothetical protein
MCVKTKARGMSFQAAATDVYRMYVDDLENRVKWLTKRPEQLEKPR